LLGTEIAASKKYYIIFFVVLTIFFSATVSMFSTAIDVPKQYKNQLHKRYPDGAAVLINDLKNIDSVKDCGADYITIYYTYGTEQVRLKNGDKKTAYLSGEAHVFKDEINKTSYLDKEEQPFISGRAWKGSDNNNQFKVWLSESTAKALEVSAGDRVVPEFDVYYEFVVTGVYKDNPSETGSEPDFIIALDLVLRFCEIAKVDIAGMGMLEVYDVLDVAKLSGYLEDNGILCIDILGVVDPIRSYNLSRTLFWVITALLFVVGAFAIINLASMIIDTREKTYGLYKVLGATIPELVRICFIALIFILALSVIFGIFGSYLINTYFQDIASDLFVIDFEIKTVWYAPLAVLGINLTSFILYYVGFKKRFTNISPLVILSEEK
jgi:ABC-type multidrug transport system fused ATPase/permease subunit